MNKQMTKATTSKQTPSVAAAERVRKSRRDQVGNFLDVIRGNGTLHCNAELGCATMVAIKLAVESYRQRKTMLWDPEKERLVT